jgi:hypothetical protein
VVSLRGWALAASLLLAGCGGGPALVDRGGPGIAEYSTVDDPIQCVPYARDVSGIPIRGDAWTWWDQAAGVYDRGHRPEPGAVLVLGARGRLASGHLSVVTGVVDARTILVTQSNWGSDGETRRRIYSAQSAVDVSPGNDWSEIRFYNPDTRAFGSVYSADGFIYPRRLSI